MATLDKVDKLRERTRVSFDEAKEALDASNDDLLDALIFLERKGKAAPPPEGGQYSSDGAYSRYDNNAGYGGRWDGGGHDGGNAWHGPNDSDYSSYGYGSGRRNEQDGHGGGYRDDVGGGSHGGRSSRAADKAAKKAAERGAARDRRQHERESRQNRDAGGSYGSSYGSSYRNTAGYSSSGASSGVMAKICSLLGKGLHLCNNTSIELSRYGRRLFAMPLTLALVILFMFSKIALIALVCSLIVGVRYKITGKLADWRKYAGWRSSGERNDRPGL